MRFGILKWESFDLVQGIDFGKSTIAIDTLVTIWACQTMKTAHGTAFA